MSVPHTTVFQILSVLDCSVESFLLLNRMFPQFGLLTQVALIRMPKFSLQILNAAWEAHLKQISYRFAIGLRVLPAP